MRVKTHIFLSFFLLIHCICVAQTTSIPDNNFEQALIDLGYDSGPLDNTVLTANINTVTNLDLSNLNITNLTGIEDFTELTILNCNNNAINILNVSQNTNLSELYCNNNLISNLNVTMNSALKIFWCNNNLLTNLDVSNNVNLISIDCSFNQLSSLNTASIPGLNVLVCENNQITNLDVSNNLTLNRFQCGNNLLSNINVSNNNNLSLFWCENNSISNLNVDENPILADFNCSNNLLSSLDVSNNSSLAKLNCSNNNLCRLNVKNSNNDIIIEMDFSNNINLNCVVVDNPSNDHSFWIPTTFSNYVSSQTNCSNFVNIDELNDVVTNTFYTLPTLIYGNYYTESNGNGTILNAGDTITTSQTIYIYNESICASNESSFYVLITSEDYFIPKYFTPNNDGSHDLWQVQDFTNTIESISIFNHYGKLLKTLRSNQGWNGFYRGKLMETNDYWYVITLNSGVTLKGHFTLKR